jgi:hypothetical protein
VVATQTPAQAQATAKSWAPTQVQAQRSYGHRVGKDDRRSRTRVGVVNSVAGWVLAKTNDRGKDDDVMLMK